MKETINKDTYQTLKELKVKAPPYEKIDGCEPSVQSAFKVFEHTNVLLEHGRVAAFGLRLLDIKRGC